MATVALNIYTQSYPTITNDIEIRVYEQADPLAVVASDRKPGPTHPLHTWSFPGLPRTNYLFRVFEVVGSSIIQQLGDDMDVVPGLANGVEFRATEQIQADVTTGVTSGVNTFTMNGTAGTEDWRGWEISTIDRIGTGPMKKGVDYNYNSSTGVFTLLQGGDIIAFQEWFNVEFEAQNNAITQSTPTVFPLFASAKLITANYTINAGTDFNGLLIVDPPGNYIELTLPDIATVVALRSLTIEMRRSTTNKCCKIITQSGQTIDWLHGGRDDLYICPNETIKIYKWIDTTNPSSPVSMWRTVDANGNFLRVGHQIGDDQITANMFNVVEFVGTQCDVFQFARFYNDYVSQLPPSQLVNYDDWSTSNKWYCFSLANSSNPANANKFRIPLRTDIVEKISNGSRLPGIIEGAQVGAVTFSLKKGNGYNGGGVNSGWFAPGDPSHAQPVDFFTANAGLENLIKTVAIRRYCYV